MKALWQKQRQKQLAAEKRLYVERTNAYIEAIGGAAALAAAAPAATAFQQAGAVREQRESELAPPVAPAAAGDAREATYVARHRQRMAEAERSRGSSGSGGTTPGGASKPEPNAAVAAMRAKYQAREAAHTAAMAATIPASPVGERVVSVTFTEAGSLGLKFGQHPKTGAVVVKSINPGTQAERHTILGPGLTLVAVGPLNVVGMTYADTIAVIKKQGRPLTCQFVSRRVVQKTSVPLQLEPEPEPELELEPEPRPPVERLELNHSPSAPDSEPEDQGSSDLHGLDPVVRDILEEEGLLQYTHALEASGLISLQVLTQAGADEFKAAGLKTGHAKRLVKVLGRSTEVKQALAADNVVPEPPRFKVADADNEDDPGELSSHNDIGDTIDTVSKPEVKSANTPTIHIPPAVVTELQRPVEPLNIRTTPRTPSDGLPPPILTPPSLFTPEGDEAKTAFPSEDFAQTVPTSSAGLAGLSSTPRVLDDTPAASVLSSAQPIVPLAGGVLLDNAEIPPSEMSIALTRHPKHGFGLDVSDVLAITSVRGEAVGKVPAPGWEIVCVGGEGVRTKTQLAKALQKADLPAGAALNFVLREVREETGVSSSAASTATGTATSVVVTLERHSKHGYGLDLSDDLVIESVRLPAQGKVQRGWTLKSVAGHCVRTKRDLASILQRLAAAVVDSPEARFSGLPARVNFEFAPPTASPEPATTVAALPPVAAECSVELRRHAKHGYGIDVSDSLVITSVRGPAVAVVEPKWTVSEVNGIAVGSKKQLAAALHTVVVDAAVRFVLRKANAAASKNLGSSRLTLRRHPVRGYGLAVNDELVVTSLRTVTDAIEKVGLGWRLEAVAGIPVTCKQQLLSVLSSPSTPSLIVSGTFSMDFLFRHTDREQSTGLAGLSSTPRVLDDTPAASVLSSAQPIVPLAGGVLLDNAEIPPTEMSIALTRHPKHGFGLDVSDVLAITSVRGEAVGKVPAPGWEIVCVGGEGVRTKTQLAKALQKADLPAGAALNFVLREVREETGVSSSAASTKQTTRTEMLAGATFEVEAGDVSRAGDRHLLPEVFEISQLEPAPIPAGAPPATTSSGVDEPSPPSAAMDLMDGGESPATASSGVDEPSPPSTAMDLMDETDEAESPAEAVAAPSAVAAPVIESTRKMENSPADFSLQLDDTCVDEV